MATTDYQAGIETDDLIMSYVAEAAWGVTPSNPAFKKIRLDSESFKGAKERKRPDELSNTGQASAAITVREGSTGGLNFSVSAGTHNDLLASSLNGVWTTPVSYSGSDVAITAASIPNRTATLTATAGAFTTTNLLIKGQFIKVFAAGTDGADNSFIARILAVTSATELSLDCVSSATIKTSTAGNMGACTIKGSCLRNGTTVNMFTFEKQLAAALFMRYTGCYPNSGSLEVGDGDYLKGVLSFLNKEETSATSGISGATYTDAPTGTVINSVSGIGNVWRGVDTGTTPGVPAVIEGITKKIGVKWNKDGSGAQTGIGSKAAVGIRKGKTNVTGSLATYFKDFALYTQFKDEQSGPIMFHALDGLASASATKGYVITICNATIMNPSIVAGGSGQDVMAEFEIEGNPDISSTSIYAGKTIQIDYFA